MNLYGLTPGTWYGLGWKGSLDPDPFNTWELFHVFEANAQFMQFLVTAESPAFFTVVNLYEYTGPMVSLISPPEPTLSGNVQFQVAVKDIFPLVGLDVFVGPTQVGRIQPGQKGIITVPTHWFPNGEQQIWVQAVNQSTVPVDSDGDGDWDDVRSFSKLENLLTVNFANEVYMQNYSPVYSAGSSITLEYAATAPQDYTFQVLGLNNDLLHSETGQSVNGLIAPQWNFTDLSGQPVDDGGYIFSLTSNRQGSPPGSGTTIRTPVGMDKGVSLGKYVFSYGEWSNSPLNVKLLSMSLQLSRTVNFATYNDFETIPGRDAYGNLHADYSSDPFAIRKATETSDLLALQAALADTVTASWLFEGHSGPNIIIPGKPPYLSVALRHEQIAGLLGNAIPDDNSPPVYSRRLFSIIISGCHSLCGLLPAATGTPLGVKQEGNYQIKKSAFIGFKDFSYSGQTKFNWLMRIHTIWIDTAQNYDWYQTPLKTGYDPANMDYPEVVTWKPDLVGYRYLYYDGSDNQ